MTGADTVFVCAVVVALLVAIGIAGFVVGIVKLAKWWGRRD